MVVSHYFKHERFDCGSLQHNKYEQIFGESSVCLPVFVIDSGLFAECVAEWLRHWT